MDPQKITACLITFNEADRIEDCLQSLAWADEIVVVDSLSTDNTVELAEQLGARVIHQEFLGHVRQKDLAVRSASNRWVLCLDADERLQPGGEAALRSALAADVGADGSGSQAGYAISRHTFYMGAWINHCGWWPEYRVRLFDRERARWVGVDPHDRVELDGPSRRLDAGLAHYSYRDLSHHVEKMNTYTNTMANGLYEGGKPASLLSMLVNPSSRFVKIYFLRQGFRDGVRGFIVAVTGSFYVFLKYAKLWERHKGGGKS